MAQGERDRARQMEKRRREASGGRWTLRELRCLRCRVETDRGRDQAAEAQTTVGTHTHGDRGHRGRHPGRDWKRERERTQGASAG